MGFKLSGYMETTRKFNHFRREIQDAAGEGAQKSSGELYRDSQKQVPRDTNALASSGRYIYHSQSGPRRSTGIKYGYPGEGDNILDYAAAVHEILKASHAPPTKAKYVEDPLVQGIPVYKSLSALACRGAVKRSFR